MSRTRSFVGRLRTTPIGLPSLPRVTSTTVSLKFGSGRPGFATSTMAPGSAAALEPKKSSSSASLVIARSLYLKYAIANAPRAERNRHPFPDRRRGGFSLRGAGRSFPAEELRRHLQRRTFRRARDARADGDERNVPLRGARRPLDDPRRHRARRLLPAHELASHAPALDEPHGGARIAHRLVRDRIRPLGGAPAMIVRAKLSRLGQ